MQLPLDLAGKEKTQEKFVDSRMKKRRMKTIFLFSGLDDELS
jgi:hypothetical protein